MPVLHLGMGETDESRQHPGRGVRAEADEQLADEVFRLRRVRQVVEAVAAVELLQFVIDEAGDPQQPVTGAARDDEVLHPQLE